jgi:cardiolipin synthase
MAILADKVTALLTQPGDGISGLLDAIEGAEQTIHIVIFRFDRSEIEAALKRAVKRGVFVHALVAFTMAGQGGEASLRKLEMRLLADGITVTRTATDLVRYHNKLMVVDGKTLFVLCYNYTYLDIERSRSFGIVTNNIAWVEEAEKLFAADTMRQPYVPTCDTFLVSPGNARHHLMAFLSGAERQLLIYEGKLSDPGAMRILAAKVKAGVDVRVIGFAGKRAVGVHTKRPHIRLHARAIIRDGKHLFMGSQSLRVPDLDARREVGILVDDPEIIGQLMATFEADWTKARGVQEPATTVQEAQADLALERGTGENARNGLQPEITLQMVKSVMTEAIKDAILDSLPESMGATTLKETVKGAARQALIELAS